ncbi:carbohydrate ABC transporter permease [Agromyces cerinus]|uniref:Carbohydrate ABC transporter membrane protein 2, CUT1 family n=1 Tax=Agromyces cerinus subsp. cerinus TaxID=232089 RepID=A0A1N6GJF5_9MICO|nr:carbohydrate ABC transporter permease [Agromyces cerinus]SIO07665.1 carbohydrate ABC transporter membrane protein 2, CUT1 family [Agromyces cerinus subsp. cerinus]
MPNFTSRLFIRGVLFLGVVYFLIPIWWLLTASTKSSSELFSSPPLWFGEDFVLLDNIVAVLTRQDGLFVRWMLNSLIYAGGGAIGATLLSAAAGYVFAKYSFPGKGALFGAILASILLPASLLVMPLYLLFSSLGMINTMWAVIIPSLVSPFGVFLARITAQESVPDDLLDAARIDGAGEIRIFSTIALPIMGPALLTVFLFSFVGIWNNFFLPMVTLNDAELWPAMLGLYFWGSQPSELNYHFVITGSLLSIIPLAIAFISLQKYWRVGLTAGAVKI